MKMLKSILKLTRPSKSSQNKMMNPNKKKRKPKSSTLVRSQKSHRCHKLSQRSAENWWLSRVKTTRWPIQTKHSAQGQWSARSTSRPTPKTSRRQSVSKPSTRWSWGNTWRDWARSARSIRDSCYGTLSHYTYLRRSSSFSQTRLHCSNRCVHSSKTWRHLLSSRWQTWRKTYLEEVRKSRGIWGWCSHKSRLKLVGKWGLKVVYWRVWARNKFSMGQMMDKPLGSSSYSSKFR